MRKYTFESWIIRRLVQIKYSKSTKILFRVKAFLVLKIFLPQNMSLQLLLVIPVYPARFCYLNLLFTC